MANTIIYYYDVCCVLWNYLIAFVTYDEVYCINVASMTTPDECALGLFDQLPERFSLPGHKRDVVTFNVYCIV